MSIDVFNSGNKYLSSLICKKCDHLIKRKKNTVMIIYNLFFKNKTKLIFMNKFVCVEFSGLEWRESFGFSIYNENICFKNVVYSKYLIWQIKVCSPKSSHFSSFISIFYIFFLLSFFVFTTALSHYTPLPFQSQFCLSPILFWRR